MLYFKKVYFNYEDKVAIEATLRKISIKRTAVLDLKSSTSNIGTDKYFFGYDGKDNLCFTRVRSSVEWFLPKIIFCLPKNEVDFFYKFRLSALPFILLALIFIGLLWSLISFLTGRIPMINFVDFAIFPVLFISLIFIEFKITSAKIRKAIIKYHTV